MQQKAHYSLWTQTHRWVNMGNSVFVGWDYVNEYISKNIAWYLLAIYSRCCSPVCSHRHRTSISAMHIYIYIYIYMTCMFRCKRFVDLDHLRHVSGFTLQKLPRPAEHPQFLRMIWKAYSHMSIAQTHQPQVKTKNFAVPRNTCWILLGERFTYWIGDVPMKQMKSNEIYKNWTFKKIAWMLMDFVRKTGVQNFSNVLKPWTDW